MDFLKLLCSFRSNNFYGLLWVHLKLCIAPSIFQCTRSIDNKKSFKKTNSEATKIIGTHFFISCSTSCILFRRLAHSSFSAANSAKWEYQMRNSMMYNYQLIRNSKYHNAVVIVNYRVGVNGTPYKQTVCGRQYHRLAPWHALSHWIWALSDRCQVYTKYWLG